MQIKPCVQFDNLTIQNGRTFRDLAINLFDQGIVSIVGRNGCGKSSIFNILEAIIYSSTSTGHKRDNLVTFDDDAFFALDFRLRDRPMRIEYYRISGKWKHKVFVDGKAIGHHSVIEEAKEAAKAIGLSKKEFEGSVHLTQHASHVLISGLPSERKKYIAEFFELDERWDAVWEAAKKELEKTKERVQVLSNYSHTIAALKSQLDSIPEANESAMEVELATARQQLTIITDSYYSLWQRAQAYELYLPHAEYFDAYEDPASDLAELQTILAQMERRIALARAARQRNVQTLARIQERAGLERELSDLIGAFPTIRDFNQSEFVSLSQKARSWKEQAHYRSEYQSLADVVFVPCSDLEAQLLSGQQRLTELRSHRATQLSGKCLSCGSTFDGQHVIPESEVAALTSEVQALQKALADARKNNAMAERRASLVSLITAEEPRPDEMSRLLDLESQSAAYDRYLRLCHALSSPPPVIEEVEDDTLLVKKADGLKAEVTRLAQLVSLQKQIGRNVPEPVDQLVLSEAKALCASQQDLVTAIGNRLAMARANAATRLRLSKDIADLEKELLDLDKLKGQELFWKAMADAYGPKGLRVDDLNRVMDVVIKRLPYNAAKLFDDPNITFRHVTDAGNIEVLISRVGKDPGTGELVRYEHDISSLSGGEARRLSVALVVTMAECVVNIKRTNMLILDEVDSNLDSMGKHKYINDFLPSLRGRWNTVFVISHDEEIQQAAIYDQVWKLEKVNGWSDLQISDMRMPE